MIETDLSKEEGERYVLSYSDREEWWIAPAMPFLIAPREWRNSEEGAINDAKELAEKHNCMYEVYKRVCIISKE